MTQVDETPEGDSRFPRWWLMIPFVGKATIITLFLTGLIAGTIWGLAYLTQRTLQTQCLAQTLDVNLDKFGIARRGKDRFRQQAEAAARIHIRRVNEGKEFYCPPGNVGGKIELARRWFLTSSKNWAQSERLVIVDEVARNAFWGSYAYPWPPEFECVNEYKATHLRNPMVDRGKYAGSIDNMSLYCEQ